MSSSSPIQAPEIARLARSPEFRQELVDLLVEICQVDTTPRANVAGMRDGEQAVFDILTRAFDGYGFEGAHTQDHPMSPAIEEHPFFSRLYYTKSPQQPEGLSVEACYGGRKNLLLLVDGDGRSDAGVNQAINAHIDVIAPYFPPRVEGDTVFGRGACDDKGNIVALMGALKLTAAYLKQRGLRLNRNLTAMLVIDEESGGNGSLSVAIDHDLKKRYDSLTVLEICQSRLFPGNRGCVWYKAEGEVPGANLFEACAYVIEELEKEGRSIRSESRDPLFPHRPVQTCHGIIGSNGEHPSRINGEVAFHLRLDKADNRHGQDTRARVEDVIQFALDEYTGVYGDKTKPDKSGKVRVDHHHDIEQTADGYKVTVWGSTGHMGSIFENDGAITKMMTMIRALIRSRSAIAGMAGGTFTLHLDGWDQDDHLLLEGGQGFLPTHKMDDVQTRLRTAAQRGLGYYLGMMGHDPADAAKLNVTYDKLHNAAFAGAIDSSDVLNAVACAKAADMWTDDDEKRGLRGWDVSCDSRIFAKEYEDQGLNVLTTGPGSLNYAHSDHEQIDIPEMVRFAEFLAYYILKQTGTID